MLFKIAASQANFKSGAAKKKERGSLFLEPIDYGRLFWEKSSHHKGEYMGKVMGDLSIKEEHNSVGNGRERRNEKKCLHPILWLPSVPLSEQKTFQANTPNN